MARKDATQEMGLHKAVTTSQTRTVVATGATYNAVPPSKAFGPDVTDRQRVNIDDPMETSMSSAQLRASDKSATKIWLIVYSVILSPFALALAIVALAWMGASSARPYSGLLVDFTSSLPYWGFEFSVWNLSLAFGWFMTFAGVVFGLITIKDLYNQIYDVSYNQQGMDFYIIALAVLCGPPIFFAGLQLSGVQDIFQLLLAVFVEHASIFALFSFVKDNRRPLLGMITTDKAGSAMAAWMRYYMQTQWIGYLASWWFFIGNMVLHWTYAITYLQQYGPTANRSVLVIVFLLFYDIPRILAYLLFGLRYGASDAAGKNLRIFGIFGISVLFLWIATPAIVLLSILFWPTVSPSGF